MNSLRKDILAALVELFESVVVGEPAGDYAYTIAWPEVTRRPIDNLAIGRKAVMGIYPTGEQKSDKVSEVRDSNLRVVFEAHLTRDVENIEDLLEDALSEIEQRLHEDYTLGGLARDVRVVETDTNIDGQFANYASCTVVANVSFRHMRSSPARRLGT